MNLDDYNAYIEQREAYLNSLTTWENVTRDETHWVYRYWNDDFDEGHRLLYVGFTGDFYARDSVHWSQSAWRRSATRIDMDAYPTRAAARAAEAVTISTEVPLFNIHKNPRCEEVHGEWKRERERLLEEYYAEVFGTTPTPDPLTNHHAGGVLADSLGAAMPAAHRCAS